MSPLHPECKWHLGLPHRHCESLLNMHPGPAQSLVHSQHGLRASVCVFVCVCFFSLSRSLCQCVDMNYALCSPINRHITHTNSKSVDCADWQRKLWWCWWWADGSLCKGCQNTVKKISKQNSSKRRKYSYALCMISRTHWEPPCYSAKYSLSSLLPSSLPSPHSLFSLLSSPHSSLRSPLSTPSPLAP